GCDGQEEARQPAHVLRLANVTGAPILDACVGHTRGRHSVARRDVDRVDHAGEANELGAAIDRDLLLARYEEIAVLEHFDDGHGKIAVEQIVARRIALALEFVAGRGLDVELLQQIRAGNARLLRHACLDTARAAGVAARLLACGRLLFDHHRKGVTDEARAPILEQDDAGEIRLIDRPWVDYAFLLRTWTSGNRLMYGRGLRIPSATGEQRQGQSGERQSHTARARQVRG